MNVFAVDFDHRHPARIAATIWHSLSTIRDTIERDHFGGAINTYSGEPPILSLVNLGTGLVLLGRAGMSVLGRAHIAQGGAAALFHEQQNSEKRVTVLLRGLAAGLFASVNLVLSTELFAGGDWPDGPNKYWFQGLKRPDNAKHPYRDEKSLFCCGVADTVKTKFKVERADQRYPEDSWCAWIKDEWLAIPPEKIVQDYAPDGQAYLFMLSDTVQCFVRPKGGL